MKNSIIQKKSIAYGLWQSNKANAGDSSPPLRDLTLSWLRFGYQGSVIESGSLNAILDQAIEQGYRACLIQVPGNIISENWMLPHWQKDDFHRCVEQLFAKDDFLVCANFIQVADYYALDPSCMFINLEHYQALGCPNFGSLTKKKQTLIHPKTVTTCTSTLAYKLEATTVFKSIIPRLTGWGFIDASLRKGFSVSPLPKEIAEKRVFISPDLHNPAPATHLANCVTNAQEKFLTGVDAQISRGRTGVFLWNIESYADVPNPNTDTKAQQVISNLYCVAAGFKPNMLLNRHGFTNKTRITFFDYSEQALKIRQRMIQQWNGLDYPAFCKQLMHEFKDDQTFYQLWDGLNPAQINWDDVDTLWQSELQHWGGEQNFQKKWLEQQKLQYEFVHADIVNNPAPLLDKLSNSPGAMIWWSNAFFTISSNWLMTIEQRRQRFRYAIDAIAQQSPDCRLYGADHNNTPVNKVTAADYSKQLKDRYAKVQFDELITHQHSAHPLRF